MLSTHPARPSSAEGAARALRVLVVTPSFLPNVGGVERHVAETVSRHRAAGHDVTVLTVDETGKLASTDTFDGVPVLRVRAYPADRDYKFAPGMAAAIADAHSRLRFDLMHLQCYHTLVAPMALAAAHRVGLPAVVTFHSGAALSGFRAKVVQPLQNALLRRHLLRARSLIAVSSFEADRLAAQLRLPRSRFAVIPNGSDLPPVPAGTTRSAEPLLVSFGRLEEYKGHQHLIAAVPDLRAAHPGLRVRVAGSGPYAAELAALAERLGVSDVVQIEAVAPADRPGMAALLFSASAVVMLSEYESQGIGAYEALSVGTAVVVRNSSAFTELVSSGHATGVDDPSDVPSVAAAVTSALGRAQAPVPVTSWDECADRLLSVYASVLTDLPTTVSRPEFGTVLS